MKKLLSLALALCMMLTAVSALAEGEVTGTWYMKMLGLNVGSFELDTEGKCLMTAESSEGVINHEGTWALEDTSLTLTIGENSLPMVWDGENLTMDISAIMALAPDMAGMDMSSVDTSTLGMLFEVSREPGKISSAAFSAYQADGTLPEGVTEEDMQAAQAEMMSALFLLMGSSTGDSGSSDEDLSGAITVLEENCFTHDNYGSQGETYLAKIQNSSENPVYVSSLVLTLKDADGNEVGKTEYPRAIGSRYLEPGEVTFISATADINEGAVVADHEVKFDVSSTSWQTPDISIEVSDPELRTDTYGSRSAAGTITNSGEQSLTGITIVFAVRDAEGKLVDVIDTGLYGAELPAGSSLILLGSISYNIAEYCTANNIVPTSVEALAAAEGTK